ncbi:MAG: ATP synthase family protein [Candidatus Xenolissoclinum pacificiensis L6]|uniref:ATP synthase family protein n=1 Tax=Candidatus Xenolissoclinum pacificiensis L6 TaxID=1401685 RepID=W2V3C2_9RICK|nr:MAG: ATP synthase family protein [Candidatus Xenolissoclinum pacificiensis L6]
MSAGNLKRLKERIESVTSTQKITEVMKLMSSYKLKKSRNVLENARLFFNKVNHIMSSTDIFDIKLPIKEQYKNQNLTLIIVISSSKSLCGNYNNIIIKRTTTFLEDQSIFFIPIGKKVSEFLTKNISDQTRIVKYIEDNYLSFDQIKELVSFIIETAKFKEVKVLHNELFKSSASVKLSDLLHVQPTKVCVKKSIFEPSQQEVYSTLNSVYLNAKIFLFLYKSIVAEHMCRVIAMDSASTNASNIAQDLKRAFNKSRQEKITNEILEITSSAESFKQ